MTAQENHRFLQEVKHDKSSIHAYYNMLGSVDAATSQCSRPDDLARIHESIKLTIGFKNLNRMLFEMIEQWMQEQVCAQVASELAQFDESEAMRWNCVLMIILLQQGRFEEAVVLGQHILDHHRRENDPEICISMTNLSSAYDALGKFENALKLNEEVLEWHEQQSPPSASAICDSVHNLSVAYSKLKRHDDALAMQEKLLDIRRQLVPADESKLQSTMLSLANTYRALSRFSDALRLEHSVLDWRQKSLPKNHPDIGTALYNMSGTLVCLGDVRQAVDRISEATRIFDAVLPQTHPLRAQARDRYVSILTRSILLDENGDECKEPDVDADDTSAHSAAAEHARERGGVIITRQRDGGYAAIDCTLQFRNFNTFVADIRLRGCCFYFEVEVLQIVSAVQFGVCTQGFEFCEDAQRYGTGDDPWSWAVDGVRMQKRHGGEKDAFGSVWSVGDVIGFALDMCDAGAATMSVSVNGSFAAPNGVAFTGMDVPYLSPSLTGSGRYRFNFGDRAFAYTPPDEGDHISVHAYHLSLQ